MRSAVFTGFVCCAAAASAHAAVTHRFDFNTDGQVTDRVGTMTGSLVNGATVAGGQLAFSPSVNTGKTTDPATGQYATLSGNPINTQSFSVEAWFTYRGGSPWQRIIDFGTQVAAGAGGTNGQGFAMLTPANSANAALGQISINSWGDPADTDYVTSPANAVALNTQQYIVWTHNFTTQTERIYVNGALVGTATADTDPSTTNYSSFFIGRSMFSVDPLLNGSINELSFHDTAMTNNQIVANYFAGPSVPEPAVVWVVGLAAIALRRRAILPRRS